MTEPSEPIGKNAKVVLYFLFIVIIIAIVTYAFTAAGKNFDAKNLSNQQIVTKFQQLEMVNAVYIAVISGALALGGTLVTRLWPRGV